MASGDPEVDRDDRQLACETVLKSRTFARSEQLQGFLRYICEMELGGRGAEISEYSIAVVALNRRADYAPGEDSSVRSRAHALRRKLQEFYEAESPDADWRIELPKGSYRPLFVERQSLLPSTAPVEINVGVGKRSAASPVRAFLFGILLASVVAAMLFPFLANRFRPDRVDPVLREAWGPAVAAGSDVLIVVDCPPVARTIPSQPGVAPQSKVYTDAPPMIAAWYVAQNLQNLGGPVYMFPTRGYARFSDMLAVTRVTTVVAAAGASFQIVPEPSVRPTAIHERSLVLIGSPAHAPYIARLLKAMPYSIRYDPARNEEVIGDGPPGSARNVFVAKRDSVTRRFSAVYGLITVLPSQPGRERPERTLIFSGITGSPGAEAAIQFFTSRSALQGLGKRFQQEGRAQFPAAYQVVVRCGVDMESAINSVYEAHRIMASPPLIE